MILDKNSTRPKDLLRLDLGLPQTGQKVIRGELKRLMPKSDYRLIEKMHVPHSSIDMNGHVNNTEYIRWGINGLRQKFKVRIVFILFRPHIFPKYSRRMSSR